MSRINNKKSPFLDITDLLIKERSPIIRPVKQSPQQVLSSPDV